MECELLCRYSNHELVHTLVGYKYIGKLRVNGKFMFVNMTKSLVKFQSILLNSKENRYDYASHRKKIMYLTLN